MTKTYTYLKQADGTDAWITEEWDENGELVDRYMTYEDPNAPSSSEIDIDTLSDEQILKLKQRFDALK